MAVLIKFSSLIIICIDLLDLSQLKMSAGKTLNFVQFNVEETEMLLTGSFQNQFTLQTFAAKFVLFHSTVPVVGHDRHNLHLTFSRSPTT